VPYGKGTSVEGHVCAIDNRASVCLDMGEMTGIDFGDDGDIESDVDSDGGGVGSLQDGYVTVGAGVTRLELNEALRHTGMQFMVDPGADATIGGMVACGASGTTTVKYGPIRSNILSLEVVLPPGIIVPSTGTRASKSSAGYDLTSLICGSEGTLGVITKVTVKLHPIPDNLVAARCEFDSIRDAAGAVAALRVSRIDVERCELLDGPSLDAFYRYAVRGSGDGEKERNIEVTTEEEKGKPTLFFEFSGPTPIAVEEHVTLAKLICTSPEYCGSKFVLAQDESERRALWSARHKLYHACLALRPGSSGAVVTDACVPLSKLAEVMEATSRDVLEAGVVGPCFGHAGDGNFHCIMPLLEEGIEDEDYRARVELVNAELMRRTLEAGGTCTGEHGIGYGKLTYLEKEIGENGLEMMKMIKRGLDPQNIMNPGKVVVL